MVFASDHMPSVARERDGNSIFFGARVNFQWEWTKSVLFERVKFTVLLKADCTRSSDN